MEGDIATPAVIYTRQAYRFVIYKKLKIAIVSEICCGGRNSAVARGAGPRPEDVACIPDAKRVDPKTWIGDTGRMRKRWKDWDGTIYEWDYQHGTVEKYDKRGVHQREFDPATGEKLKEASPIRRVQP